MIPSELTALRQWVSWKIVDGRKLPCRANGAVASTTDPTTWATYEEVAPTGKVGFVFTKDDPYVGVDLDDCLLYDGSGFQPNELASWLITEAVGHAYMERSVSGNGIHIICRGPQLPNGRSFGAVEYYPHGRFFICTGNVISTTERLGDPGERFWKHCGLGSDPRNEVADDRGDNVGDEHDDAGSVRPSIPMVESSEALERARMYAKAVPGAISGSGGHNHTFSLICKLAEDFALDESQIWDVIEEWNQTCSPPWSQRELDHKINQALRKTAGSPMKGAAFVDDLDAIEGARIYAGSLKKADQLPEHLLDIPGPMGRFVEWCTESNHRRNRVLSLCGAIAWMCHLTGRKIQDSSGIRTNLYIVGLAPSAGGKQAALESIKILGDLGTMPDSIVGKVTSDSAIASQLVAEPSTLCLWDEFGLFLQKTKGNGALASVQDVMLELWGCTRTNWRAKKYVDGSRDIKVPQPCFSFLGMSTPDHFWTGMTRMHLRDGFAGRLLVIDSGPRAERGEVMVSDPPVELVEYERKWNRYNAGNLAGCGIGPPTVPIAKVSSEASEVFDELLERIDLETDDDRASIWGRAIEKARKLALLYACSAQSGSGKAPTVDLEAATWGTSLAKWATTTFISRAFNSIGSGDQHGSACAEVMAVLRSKGAATRKDLLTATGISVRLLGSVLETLIDSGKIEESKRGREKVYLLK